MIPESEFQFKATPKPKRKSRKMRKNYDVTVLPERKAKGRYPKGQGFNKRTRIKGRKPIMGDAIRLDNEDVIWLRVKRA